MKKFAISCGLLWVCITSLTAVSGFHARELNPLTELWRWQEVSNVRQYVAHDMCDQGRLWFATTSGVARYDGSTWTQWESVSYPGLEDIRAIFVWRGSVPVVQTGRGLLRFEDGDWKLLAEVVTASMSTRLLDQDPWDNLWAATADGLLRVTPSGELSMWVQDRRVNTLHITAGGEIWYGTLAGLIGRNAMVEQGLVQGMESDVQHVFRGLRGRMMSIGSSPDNEVWAVAATHGSPLMRYCATDDAWSEFARPDDVARLNVFDLKLDSSGRLWLSMPARLVCWDGVEWQVFAPDTHPIPFFRFHITETPDGFLWLGPRGSMPQRIDAYTGRWRSYENLGFKLEDKTGNEWFITGDQKMVLHHRDSGSWSRYDQQDGLMTHPVAMNEDLNGLIWVFGSNRDVAAVNLYMDGRWVLHEMPEFAPGVGKETVKRLRDGRMAMGWAFAREPRTEALGGLVLADFSDEEGFVYEHLTSPVVPARIASVAEAGDGSLFFASTRLERFDGEQTAIVDDYVWKHHLPAPMRTVNDREGNIWVCHWGQGVAVYDGESWRTFTTEDGLASELVSRIYLSPDGTIWVGTIKGYSRYDENGWVTLALPDTIVGDQGPNELNFAGDGSVWANLLDQLWYQYDDTMGFTQEFRSLDLKTVFYRLSQSAPRTYFDQRVQRVSSEGNVTFSWRGKSSHKLGYDSSLSFSYRINGGDWSDFKEENQAIFTGLGRGSYTLDVRARDRDMNIEVVPASVSFEVLGVIWTNPWFLGMVGGFVFIILGLVTLAIWMRFHHLVHVEELKVQFFTNISHELRTPLSVIMGPLQSVMASTENKSHRRMLSMAIRNANHMIRLIDEILEFRRAQSIRFKPRMSRVELRHFFREAIQELQPLVDQKEQKLEVSIPESPLWIESDQDKLLKIFDNLFTNAVKYTPNCGFIRITVRIEWCGKSGESPMLCMVVEDTGIGIPAQKKKRIFTPFYRAHESEKNVSVGGTGIGLAIVNELVRTLDGHIEVESPYKLGSGLAQGSRFTVSVPIAIVDGPGESEPDATVSLDVAGGRADAFVGHDESTEEIDEDQEDEQPPGVPVILVVEDNGDIRQYLREELQEEFEVMDAANGLDAIRLAKDTTPDLVLSDVMMPGMDGLELTRHIKGDVMTSHIPVILLTARKSLTAQLTGLESGADDYIPKPFNISVLRQKIRNLLEQRQRMRERFARQVFIGPSDICVTPLDETFLKKAMGIVEEHIADFEFDVNVFAREMGMSRASLYRKFKAISGESPAKFLRNMRMERAAQYLKAGVASVSEVVEKVGFLDHSYFCLCFRKKFNCTPTEFSQQHQIERNIGSN